MHPLCGEIDNNGSHADQSRHPENRVNREVFSAYKSHHDRLMRDRVEVRCRQHHDHGKVSGHDGQDAVVSDGAGQRDRMVLPVATVKQCVDMVRITLLVIQDNAEFESIDHCPCVCHEVQSILEFLQGAASYDDKDVG